LVRLLLYKVGRLGVCPRRSLVDDGAVRPSGLRSLLGRRSVWAVAALVLAVALAFGLRALFGKAKVRYVTVAVERGDLESTVVAAGILQPIKYVDVGAQVSGKLKLLKVVRGDHVALDELLGEIAPELLDTVTVLRSAMRRMLGADWLALRVCPSRRLMETTSPAMGAVIRVKARFERAESTAALACFICSARASVSARPTWKAARARSRSLAERIPAWASFSLRSIWAFA